MSEALKEAAEFAGLYGLLAQYYKYRDREMFLFYEDLHLSYTEKTAALARELHAGRRPLRSDSLAEPPGELQEPAAILPAKSAMPRDSSRLRAIHAIPGGTAKDVYLNGRRLLHRINYHATTDYFAVPSGTFRIDVKEAEASGEALATKEAQLLPGASYTLTILGHPEQQGPELILYMDQPFAPPGAVHLRLLHLSPDAKAVDIAAEGERPLVPGIPYKGATRYIPLLPGTYHLEIREEGTKRTLLPIPNMKLSGGIAYTLAVTGRTSGQPQLSAKLLRG